MSTIPCSFCRRPGGDPYVSEDGKVAICQRCLWLAGESLGWTTGRWVADAELAAEREQRLRAEHALLTERMWADQLAYWLTQFIRLACQKDTSADLDVAIRAGDIRDGWKEHRHLAETIARHERARCSIPLLEPHSDEPDR